MTLFKIRNFLALAIALLSFYEAKAQSSMVRIETEALFKKLETGACQFNRNGTWYSGSKAKEHLIKKLSYLEDKKQIKTTEEFILKGATESSVSGKAYWVKCGDAPAVESKIWLMEQLNKLRSLK